MTAPQVNGAEPATTEPSPERVGNTLGIAYAIVALASSSTAVVIPTIRDEFDLPLASGAWVITAFVVALAAFAPIYGRIADLVGPRTPITIGLSLMATGAILSAFAPTPFTLILARAVVGAGAGAMPVLGPVIIAGRLEEAEQPAALTRMAGLAATAASGLLIGAVIADFLGWRWVLALPVLVVGLIPAVRRLSFTGHGTLVGLDIAGALGVGLVAVGLNLALQLPTNATTGVVGLLLAASGVGATIFGGRGGRAPFLPRTVLARLATWKIAAAAGSIPAVFFSLLIAIPAILTEEANATRIEIGVLFVPAAFAGVLVGPLAARLRARLPIHHVASLGLATATTALLIAGLLAPQPIALAISFALVAAAFGFGQAALLTMLTLATPEAERGAALAVFMVVFFLGGSVGGTLLTVLGTAMSLAPALVVIAVVPAAAALSTLRS